MSPLTDRFFDPNATHGHRKWTVFIDGLDEMDDEERRHAVFRTILDLHGRATEAFRLIIFARPGSTPPPDEAIRTWRIAPLADASRLIDRYVRSPTSKARLNALLNRFDYREIARNPLFVAMSAALVDEMPELPTRSYELVEAFIERGIDTAAKGVSFRREAIVELLAKIALMPGIKRHELVAAARPASSRLSGASSSIRVQQDVDRVLRSTGLVRASGFGEYRFLHRLIDRHLFANAMAEAEKPNRLVWDRLHPSRIGWAGVEQLCMRWAETGEAVEEAIAALADFGEIGRDVMLRLAVQLPTLGDAIFSPAFAALISDLDEGDLTAAQEELLARLAADRPAMGPYDGNAEFCAKMLARMASFDGVIRRER